MTVVTRRVMVISTTVTVVVAITSSVEIAVTVANRCSSHVIRGYLRTKNRCCGCEGADKVSESFDSASRELAHAVVGVTVV